MVGITAEQAREIAIGVESQEVKSAITNIEEAIYRRASKGELSVQISMGYRSKAVEAKCIEILRERGFCVTQCSGRDIAIMWDEKGE